MGYIEKVSTDMSRKALKMGYRSADIMYMSRTKIKVGHKRRNIVYMSQTKTKLGQRKEDIVYMSSNVRHRTWYLYEENIYRKEKKMENHTIVTLKKGEGRTIKAGGTWIFDNEIDTIVGTFTNGDVVTVHDFDGYPMGKGFINQNSKIRIRMLTRHADQEINENFLRMRVKNAWEYRKTTVDTSSCRVIFGEADFLPGLVVDKYEDVLVVECLALGMEQFKETIVSLLKGVLKEEGISKVVMMTGDSERTAASIAKRVGVDEYYSEVLPEDKAGFIEAEKAAGRKVVMIGDGINDSPALSAADAGIAISDGAELAREIADITIAAEDLREIVVLKRLSNAMMHRIQGNYRGIVGINAMLIALGVAGIIQPTTSALLHNTSTLAISLKSMGNLLPTN